MSNHHLNQSTLQYPRRLYAATGGSIEVENAAEERALGAGWSENRAASALESETDESEPDDTDDTDESECEPEGKPDEGAAAADDGGAATTPVEPTKRNRKKNKRSCAKP